LNREFIFNRDLFQCQRCGNPATEIAHRIANTESNMKEIMDTCKVKSGEARKLLNHSFNLSASCQKCNDYFNIGMNPVKKKELLERIISDLNKADTR
jgi:5-methylcytosine-specific restriction endonuclease McrA